MVRAHTLAATLILLVAGATPATAAHTHATTAKRHYCHTNPRRPQAARRTSAVSPAVTIARALTKPCQNTQLTPTPENLQAIREATLCLINQERARNSELPLDLNQRLQQAAQGHSEQMIGENYFAHISPAGETPLQRVTEAGYLPNSQVDYAIGENIAWGTLWFATTGARESLGSLPRAPREHPREPLPRQPYRRRTGSAGLTRRRPAGRHLQSRLLRHHQVTPRHARNGTHPTAADGVSGRRAAALNGTAITGTGEILSSSFVVVPNASETRECCLAPITIARA